MEYVSPEYEERLRVLAETLVTPERFGHVATHEVVQIDASQLELIAAEAAVNDDYS
jgi:hypothetical protein